MGGKLVEINPEVSLRCDQIREVRLSHDWRSLCVTTIHGEELDAVPLEGETLEMARRRLFQAVNDQELLCEGQLAEVDSGLYINPADVVGVIEQRESVCIYLSGKGHYLITSDSPNRLAADITSRINAALRTRYVGLNAI